MRAGAWAAGPQLPRSLISHVTVPQVVASVPPRPDAVPWLLWSVMPRTWVLGAEPWHYLCTLCVCCALEGFQNHGRLKKSTQALRVRPRPLPAPPHADATGRGGSAAVMAAARRGHPGARDHLRRRPGAGAEAASRVPRPLCPAPAPSQGSCPLVTTMVSPAPSVSSTAVSLSMAVTLTPLKGLVWAGGRPLQWHVSALSPGTPTPRVWGRVPGTGDLPRHPGHGAASRWLLL